MRVPWTRQPVGASVRIDWSNPLTVGLKHAILPSPQGLYDYVTGKFATLSGSPSRETTQDGMSFKTTAGSSQYAYFDTPISGYPLTLVTRGYVDSSSTQAIISIGTASSTDRAVLFYGATAGKFSGSVQNNAGGTTGELSANTGELNTAAVLVSGSGTVAVNVNGVNSGYGSAVWSTPGTCTRLYLSARVNTTAGVFASQRVTASFAFNRALSDVELASLHRNPWQLFRPIVVPVKTASGGVSIDCTVGNATAAGIQATIQSPISIDCSVGNATAAGVSATIVIAESINCTPGNAVAAGVQASIDEVTGNTTIDCTPGNAVAAGVQASIDFVPLGESSPSYGGGGGTFRAQRSREFNRFIQGLFEEPKKKPLKQKLAQIVEDAKSEEKLQVAISSLQAAFDSKQARENAELALEVETTLRKLQTRLKELEEEEGFVVSNLLL